MPQGDNTVEIVRIGNRYFNLDRMTDIEFLDNGSALIFFSGANVHEGRSTLLNESEAIVMQR